MWTRRITLFSFVALVVGLVAARAVAQSQPAQPTQPAQFDEPSWTWPESRWRDAVNKVRSGRRLLPESWPGGEKVAVTLSFDFDNEKSLALTPGMKNVDGMS